MNEEVQANFPPKSTAPVSSNYVCRYAHVPGQAFECQAELSVKCKQMMYLRGSDAGDLTNSETFRLACTRVLACGIASGSTTIDVAERFFVIGLG